MAHLLPSRYTPEVNDRIINEAARILASAAASGKPKRRPASAIAVLLVPLAVVGGLVATEGPGVPGGTVAFDRASVIAAAATGTGARVRDFLAKGASGEPARPESTAASPSPGAERLKGSRFAAVRAGRVPSPTPLSPGHDRRAAAPAEPDEVLFDSETGYAAVVPAEEQARAVVLNVGSRIPIVLAEALTTGATAVPFGGRVASDVSVGTRVALPAGASVIGEAFAVSDNDRVQAVLAAVVVNGRTLPLQGLVLGTDGGLGLPGKVLSKGSKSKGATRRALALLGSAANAASLGMFASKPGIGGAAALELAQDASHGLDHLAQRWSPSDKVVRVPAGSSAFIYLRSDL